jgi:RNA polymerase primary sigma factor
LELQSKYKKAQSYLRETLGRAATAEEVAKYLNVELKKIQEIEKLAKDPVSLNAPLNDEDDGTVEDLVADTSIKNPDEKIDNDMLAETFNTILPSLDEREQEVIISRYGLNKHKALTLEEIGKKFGVTKERIRQIEQKALKKLRNPRRLEALKEFLA